MRRILGQCGQADFKSVEHLIRVLKKPEMLDLSTLTSRQKFALQYYAEILHRKIPLKLLKVVQEVLFWGEKEKATHIEVKFFRNRELINDIQEFKRLWY